MSRIGDFMKEAEGIARNLGIMDIMERYGAHDTFEEFVDGLFCKYAENSSRRPEDDALVKENEKFYNVGESDYAKHRIQVWDIVEEYHLDFFTGNVLKYMLRKKGRTDVEVAANRRKDLLKAKHYIEHMVSLLDDAERARTDREITENFT